MKYALACALIVLFTCNISSSVSAADAAGEVVTGVEAQPLRAQADRVAQALEVVGAPLNEEQRAALANAANAATPDEAAAQIQQVFDPLCIAVVSINPESRVKVASGPAPKKLMQQGWRAFLVKVVNEAGVTAKMRVSSPNAAPLFKQSTGSPDPEESVKPSEVPDRWMDIHNLESQPLNEALSGLKLEYRVIQLFSRDAGQLEGKLAFDVGQGTQDLGFRNEVNILFNCEPAVKVELEVLDADGKTPTTGNFIIRDPAGAVYPAKGRRLAPDFFFQDQIYRHSGEHVFLPAGKYEVTYTRGPEYKILKRQIQIDPGQPEQKLSFQLERWIKLAAHGWYSGDHHIHGAGCAHYEAPTEGVTPQDMMRHVLGEDLNIGCVLSWGPCWYFQKQFFQGKVHELSTDRYVMRYDVEVSGFPSSHAGHLCLLRLKEDDYPGTTRIEEWPSWNLPVLRWGKEQGAVVGYSHSGWGLQTQATQLPNYEMPRFDGIGANEYIVDVVHDACDFISAVDTPIHWELNIWYHTLNCGYTARISGETDFPCIYGQRVGLGRSYVKLDGGNDQPLDYDAWADGIRDGRSYCSDGLTHLFDFNINGLGVGEKGEGGRASVLALRAGEPLKVTVKAAALLDEQPRDDIRNQPLENQPYWHVERARVGGSRTVEVELIVNGQVVEKKPIEANGEIAEVTFDYTPAASTWVATRIFPAAHTNPVFVEVDGKPIRASRRSAQWCLEAVEVCWNSKSPHYRPEERDAARAAYDVAKAAYQQILNESVAD